MTFFSRARRLSLGLALIALGLHGSAAAQQQAWPTRAVKLVVPFPPGGFQDVFARQLAQALSYTWEQPVVVDNRPGAAGILASEMVAKAAPDGYTLYVVNDGPLVINPFIYRSLPYDAVNDFAPVALLASTTMVLIVNPQKVKARTVAEFVQAAKGHSLDFASGGSGGPHHLFMESFMNLAGVKLNHIPYKGGAPALQAVAAGEVAAAFAGVAPSIQLAKAGKVTILGSGGAKRPVQYPEIRTIAEQGYPGLNATAWVGVVAPKDTPQAILDKVEADSLKTMRDPQFLQKLQAAGGDPAAGSAADFRELIRKDQQRYSALIRQAGVKAD